MRRKPLVLGRSARSRAFLDKRFASNPCGKFDSDFMAKVYGEPLVANRGSEIPEPSGLASPLGRNSKDAGSDSTSGEATARLPQ